MASGSVLFMAWMSSTPESRKGCLGPATGLSGERSGGSNAIELRTSENNSRIRH